MIIDVVDQYIVYLFIGQPTIRILAYVLLVGLTLYSASSFMLARNYLIARYKKAIFGREILCDIDTDNSQQWSNASRKVGTLLLSDRAYDIADGSVIRGADCDFYIINRYLGRTLPPVVIRAANNLRAMGYKNFSHALLSYQATYHSEDYDALVKKAVEEKKDIEPALQEFNKKVYTSIMKPESTDFLTKNLAVLYQWSNQKLSAYGNKQIIEQFKLEAEQEAKRGGLNIEKLLGYAVVLAILFLSGAIAYQMIAGSSTTIINEATTTTTTTILPMIL